MQLPTLIDDTETIVRAVKAPAHFDEKKKKIKAAAYKPKVGHAVLSVIRQQSTDENCATSDDYCKNKSVQICGPSYIGLLAIKAESIRNHGCKLDDWPKDFPGHAHIDHQFNRPPDDHEPGNAQLVAELNERCRSMLKVSIQHIDPSPGEPNWKGATLRID